MHLSFRFKRKNYHISSSSSVNGLTYGRGSASVYDIWESMCSPGGGWKDVFPYFKKALFLTSQTHHVPTLTEHNLLLSISNKRKLQGLISIGLLKLRSNPRVGLAPLVNDLNFGDNIGVKQKSLTLDPMYARTLSWTSYATNIRNRMNLDILTYDIVSQVVTNGTGDELRAIDVILSAGAFQTPQLPMVSGIWPAAELAKNGIKVKVDNPNVGRDVQDHTYSSVIIRSQPSTSLNSLYFQAKTDQKIAVYAFNQLRKILACPNLAKWGIGPDNGEVEPGAAVQSGEDTYIRTTVIQVWHASGTCAMKPRADGGVLDSRLKVYKVQGLRVVDESIMPIVSDQHTQRPVYMVSGKAADMIRSEYRF
ncbi:FAD/NAD(P)-binding domain-containing protein [Acephala macrosclerotiorum]|nr:FAD/NAD(P)-binding domain-containing protein [Acephala macrosclerotiorum]